MSSATQSIPVIVSDIIEVNTLVKRFVFKPKSQERLPSFSGGAHTVVLMHDGGRVRRNPYSLMSDPNDQSQYAISVRRDDAGRGGSLFMHNKVQIGDELEISYPVNLFSLDLTAHKQLFFAGGIGITPFLAHIKQLTRLGGDWELHYASRSQALASYSDWLSDHYDDRVHLYFDDQDQKIGLDALLGGQTVGTHLYVCGPRGMIEWVCESARRLGWPEGTIHAEEFLAPQPGKPFNVQLASSSKTVEVGAQESLLEALERIGVDAPYLCRGGACGQCETRVIDYDGKFLHLDHWLDDDDKSRGDKIMPCVSRFEGKTLILDR
ncbi:MAG: PDR/VanB family oxidoreductase [Pseudomonadota bacterium]